MKYLPVFFFFIFSFSYCFSQDLQQIDKLLSDLKNHNARKLELGKINPEYDTIATNILFQLTKAYLDNNLDTAMYYAKQTQQLSEQIGFKKGISNAFNSMGTINLHKGNYSEALMIYTKSLKIREEINYRDGIAGSLHNIGYIYYMKGNSAEALKNYLAALKINEEINNQKQVTINLNNIGLIYRDQHNDSEALKYFLASLKIAEELNDQTLIAFAAQNTGIIFQNRGNYAEALEYQLRSLKIYKEKGHKVGISSSYGCIGNVYDAQQKYKEALENFFIALKLSEEIDNKYNIVTYNLTIGSIYIKQSKFDQATVLLNKALSISKEIESLDEISHSYIMLARLDSAKKNFKGSLENYKLYIAFRDSLVNEESTEKITQLQMQYDYDKKAVIQNADQERKDIVALKELQRQKYMRYGFMGGFAVVLLFAGFFLSQRNKISSERKRSEELLLNILPLEIAEEIKKNGKSQAKTFSMVTVMFTDFKDFTDISEKVSAELLVSEIDYCFSEFDNIIQKHKIEKIKTVGDAYLCVGGMPELTFTHAIDTVNAGIEIRNFMLKRKKEKEDRGEIPFEIRVGIHTGSVVAGVVGIKKFAYDIWGDTVNVAARMEQQSEAGKINISGSTYNLVKEKINCTHRGKISAKNKGDIDMYYVEPFTS